MQATVEQPDLLGARKPKPLETSKPDPHSGPGQLCHQLEPGHRQPAETPTAPLCRQTSHQPEATAGFRLIIAWA
jgi:hypothetical protein